ncbi:MAG: M28 family peptidase [Planctomycetes bacterium]|nr:M28 family peptidase [Planctomycetota bacterium]
MHKPGLLQYFVFLGILISVVSGFFDSFLKLGPFPYPDRHPDRPEVYALPEHGFDDNAAWKLLDKLVALGPRYEAGPRRAAFELIYADAAKWGAAKLERHDFVDGGIDGMNLLAEFPGQRGDEGERVVILGHYDTVPDSPGALDDATSIALLAGLGRAFAGRPLSRTVVLAAVDLKERGLLGSRAWVAREAYARRLDTIRAAVSTEMVGWKDGIPVVHAVPAGFRRTPERRPDVGGIAPAWMVGLALAVGRDTGRALQVGDPVFSLAHQVVFRHFLTPFDADSDAFAERGIPAIYLSDCSLTHPYPRYHKSSDTLDQVDRPSLAAAGRSLETLAAALSWRPELRRATWNNGETDYLTWGSTVLHYRILTGILMLSFLPYLLLLSFAPPPNVSSIGSPRGAGALLLLLASVIARFGAPVSAVVVLAPTWLVAPLCLARRRYLRVLGTVLTLTPFLVATTLWLAAMPRFHRVVAPTEGGWALVLIAVISLGLATPALLARPPAPSPAPVPVDPAVAHPPGTP